MPTHEIEIDDRLLSPEAIRHNSHNAMQDAEASGVFVAVKGTILHYLKFPVLVTEIFEDMDDDDAMISLLHPNGRTEHVRYDVMQLLYDNEAVHIGCDNAMDAFFQLTGLKNVPPPTETEAAQQRAILVKLVGLIGGPSDGDWSGLEDDDIVPIPVEITIGDLKEARRALGDDIP